MKKIVFLLAAVLTVATVSAQGQPLKIKKGKVTMSEEYYNSLKARAEAYEKAQEEIAQLREQLAPPPMRTFVDSASYAIGRDVYGSWVQQRLGINADMAKSITDIAGKLTEQEGTAA